MRSCEEIVNFLELELAEAHELHDQARGTEAHQINTKEINTMKKYSAIVKDGSCLVFIKNQEYNTKADFIHDLRRNGYKVNPDKVKPATVFDYILDHTNCTPWDWKLTEKEVREMA